MISYEGIFFEDDMANLIHSLETKKLTLVNDVMHCTFKYHPMDEEILNDIVGEKFEVYLISYGNDGQNSGFEILLPDKLKKYYINYDEENPTILKPPHITASLAESAKASNTKKLTFKPLEKKVKLTGRFGYWIKDGDIEYLSYKPYTTNNINKELK